MNWTEADTNLRFERPLRVVPRRLIPIGLALALFTLLWNLVPHNILYWLMLILLAVVVWMASYGWRQALTVLIDFLYRLQQF